MKSYESKQNWLSYKFFENTYSGDGDDDDTKSLQWSLPDPLLGCNIPGYFLV